MLVVLLQSWLRTRPYIHVVGCVCFAFKYIRRRRSSSSRARLFGRMRMADLAKLHELPGFGKVQDPLTAPVLVLPTRMQEYCAGTKPMMLMLSWLLGQCVSHVLSHCQTRQHARTRPCSS